MSKYAYEVEFLPQTIVPIKITTDEIEEDTRELYEQMWEEGEKR